MKIVKPTKKEFMKIQRFVGGCKGLVQHPSHFYKIIMDYFGDSFFVAKENGDIIGFTFGFRSQDEEDLFFMWQIGVDKEYRKNGIGKALIKTVIDYAKENDIRRVRATVETGNIPSQKLFEKMSFRNMSCTNGNKVVKENGKEAIVNYYGSGTNQIIYELNLSSRSSRSTKAS